MSVHNGDNSDPTKSTWNKYYQKKNANNNLEKYRDELVRCYCLTAGICVSRLDKEHKKAQ